MLSAIRNSYPIHLRDSRFAEDPERSANDLWGNTGAVCYQPSSQFCVVVMIGLDFFLRFNNGVEYSFCSGPVVALIISFAKFLRWEILLFTGFIRQPQSLLFGAAFSRASA